MSVLYLHAQPAQVRRRRLATSRREEPRLNITDLIRTFSSKETKAKKVILGSGMGAKQVSKQEFEKVEGRRVEKQEPKQGAEKLLVGGRIIAKLEVKQEPDKVSTRQGDGE